MKKSNWNAKVAKNRGEEWRKKLREGRLQARMNPSALYLMRLAKNLTQAEIAKKIGVTVPTYGAIERAKRPLVNDRALKICSILKTDSGKLFKKLSDNKFIAKS